MPDQPMTPKGRMVWPTAFSHETEAEMHRRPEPQPTKLRDVEAGVHPYHSPTGRRFTPPEPQELKLANGSTVKFAGDQRDRIRSLEGDKASALVDVDYSQVERRVLMMQPLQMGKVAAQLMAQMKASERDIALAFAVPEEYLGQEENGPLTGDELRAIMDQQPEFREPKPRGKCKNPFAEGSIKRYSK